MPEKKAVLVSWVAVNNDPFERERGPEQCYRLSKGHKIPGPTLTLLFDENSPYSGRISDAVLLFQNKEKRALYAVRETQSAIRELDRKISITTISGMMLQTSSSRVSCVMCGVTSLSERRFHLRTA